MERTLFEQLDGTYTQQGNCYAGYVIDLLR